MKIKFTFLVFLGFTIFCLYVPNNAVYARDKTSSNPLIQIVKHPYFGLPIDCVIGESCWVMNYVDIGPDDGKNTDPACFNRTYDGHKGTDIAVPDGSAMDKGVNVLTAMDGTVQKIRDGESDRWATKEVLEQTKKDRKECGNAILIDHGNGLQSLYCHLKKNSIRVKPNQKVKEGEIIAQVGLSGFTQFPHLHFGIIWEGGIVDPFTGQNNTGTCGVQKNKLWHKDLVFDYQPLSIYGAGFSNTLPKLERLDKNSQSPKSILSNSDLLAFWVTMFGVREGDKITLEIKDPNGKIFARQEIEQPATRARQLYFTGRKLNGNPLKEGVYTGHVTVTRLTKSGEKQSWDKDSAILITP